MTKRFTLTITGSVTLRVEDIWPDGDAPENPTAADVDMLLEDCGSVVDVLQDWDLDYSFAFDVAEEKP